MNDIAIKVDQVSKKFCRRLRRTMLYGAVDIARSSMGLSSPYDRLREGEFWAVDDVSFEVKRGETLGIIGANGAGKTTILKMLNGIFMPDKGEVKIKGRVGALIEVGAGFHPMLTGRENIYINGTILGMNKREIDKKFDSIVDFSGIVDFLDSPVKHYSSGMYVRLGFAIAVHCEPDILLVDEVLAVGDIEFRMKCYKKIVQMKEHGISIILVSHDHQSVMRVCDEVIELNKGNIENKNKPRVVIDKYQKRIQQEIFQKQKQKENFTLMKDSSEIVIEKIKIFEEDGKEKKEFNVGETLNIKIEYNAKKKVKDPVFEVTIFGKGNVRCHAINTRECGLDLGWVHGKGEIKLRYNEMNLLNGFYTVAVGIRKLDKKENLTPLPFYDFRQNASYFLIKSNRHDRGMFFLKKEWEICR